MKAVYLLLGLLLFAAQAQAQNVLPDQKAIEAEARRRVDAEYEGTVTAECVRTAGTVRAPDMQTLCMEAITQLGQDAKAIRTEQENKHYYFRDAWPPYYWMPYYTPRSLRRTWNY